MIDECENCGVVSEEVRFRPDECVFLCSACHNALLEGDLPTFCNRSVFVEEPGA